MEIVGALVSKKLITWDAVTELPQASTVEKWRVIV
jgi:hypothetical protein